MHLSGLLIGDLFLLPLGVGERDTDCDIWREVMRTSRLLRGDQFLSGGGDCEDRDETC